MTQPLTFPPPVAVRSKIPALSNQQVQEVFRLMVEEYGLGHFVMIESAGRALTGLARRLVGGALAGQPIVMLAGAGNCGAVGLAAARYLASAGAQVTIILSRPVELLGQIAAHQQRLLVRAGVPHLVQSEVPTLRLSYLLRQSALIIDALIGGGLHGRPTGAEAFLIQVVRQAGQPVLSLDLPSGFPPDGDLLGRANLLVKATATLALALPRRAHCQPYAFGDLGDLYLADIGVPPSLYTRLGLKVGPIFSASELILLRRPTQGKAEG